MISGCGGIGSNTRDKPLISSELAANAAAHRWMPTSSAAGTAVAVSVATIATAEANKTTEEVDKASAAAEAAAAQRLEEIKAAARAYALSGQTNSKYRRRKKKATAATVDLASAAPAIQQQLHHPSLPLSYAHGGVPASNHEHQGHPHSTMTRRSVPPCIRHRPYPDLRAELTAVGFNTTPMRPFPSCRSSAAVTRFSTDHSTTTTTFTPFPSPPSSPTPSSSSSLDDYERFVKSLSENTTHDDSDELNKLMDSTSLSLLHPREEDNDDDEDEDEFLLEKLSSSSSSTCSCDSEEDIEYKVRSATQHPPPQSSAGKSASLSRQHHDRSKSTPLSNLFCTSTNNGQVEVDQGGEADEYQENQDFNENHHPDTTTALDDDWENLSLNYTIHELETELNGLEEEDMGAAIATLLEAHNPSYLAHHHYHYPSNHALTSSHQQRHKRKRTISKKRVSGILEDSTFIDGQIIDHCAPIGDCAAANPEPLSPKRADTDAAVNATEEHNKTSHPETIRMGNNPRRLKTNRHQVQLLQSLLQKHFQLLLQQTVLATRTAHDRTCVKQPVASATNTAENVEATAVHHSVLETSGELAEILDAAVGMLQDLDQNRKDAIRRFVQFPDAHSSSLERAMTNAHASASASCRTKRSLWGSPSFFSSSSSSSSSVDNSSECIPLSTKHRIASPKVGGDRRLTRAQFTVELRERDRGGEGITVFAIPGIAKLKQTFEFIDKSVSDLANHENLLELTTHCDACKQLLEKAEADFTDNLLPGNVDLNELFLDPTEHLGGDEYSVKPEHEVLLRCNRNLFTSGEDNLTLRGVNLFGEKQWLLVSDRFLPERSASIIFQRHSRLCILLYKAHGIVFDDDGNLEPPAKCESVDDIDGDKMSMINFVPPPTMFNVHRWSFEEDLNLLRAVPVLGHMWVEIEIRILPHRNRGHIRKRYQVLTRRVKNTVQRMKKSILVSHKHLYPRIQASTQALSSNMSSPCAPNVRSLFSTCTLPVDCSSARVLLQNQIDQSVSLINDPLSLASQHRPDSSLISQVPESKPSLCNGVEEDVLRCPTTPLKTENPATVTSQTRMSPDRHIKPLQSPSLTSFGYSRAASEFLARDSASSHSQLSLIQSFCSKGCTAQAGPDTSTNFRAVADAKAPVMTHDSASRPDNAPTESLAGFCYDMESDSIDLSMLRSFHGPFPGTSKMTPSENRCNSQQSTSFLTGLLTKTRQSRSGTSHSLSSAPKREFSKTGVSTTHDFEIHGFGIYPPHFSSSKCESVPSPVDVKILPVDQTSTLHQLTTIDLTQTQPHDNLLPYAIQGEPENHHIHPKNSNQHSSLTSLMGEPLPQTLASNSQSSYAKLDNFSLNSTPSVKASVSLFVDGCSALLMEETDFEAVSALNSLAVGHTESPGNVSTLGLERFHLVGHYHQESVAHNEAPNPNNIQISIKHATEGTNTVATATAASSSSAPPPQSLFSKVVGAHPKHALKSSNNLHRSASTPKKRRKLQF